MHCNTLIDPVCRVIGHAFHSFAGTATNGVLGGIAQAVNAGVRWVVINTVALWIHIPSPNLATEPSVTAIQHWLLPITAAVAAGGVIAAGARMALTRRANPLVDVTGGLLTLAAASTIGVGIAALLLKAGDAWSAWVLQASTGGHFTQRLELALQLGGGAAPAVVVVFGIIAIVVSLVQAVLMLFRQAALVILAGALPLAAAGAIAPLTRTWVRKVTAWMLALICYKPAAAAVYAAAFTMIGTGRSPQVALMGFVMLLLSVVMLPALMKFFTWTTGSLGSAGGGGGQLLSAVTVGAIAVGAMRSGSAGGGAQGQASYLDSHLGPPPGGASTPPSPPPGGPGPSGAGGGGIGPVSSGPSTPGDGRPADGVGTGAQPRTWPYVTPAGTTTQPHDTGATPSGSVPAAAAGSPGAAPSGAAGGAAPPAGPASTGAAGAATAPGTAAAALAAAESARAASARLAEGAMTPDEQQ